MNFLEHHHIRSLLVLLSTCFILTNSYAQTSPVIGSLLTESEMAAVKTKKTGLQDGKKTIWILSIGGSTTNPHTMVVNGQRVVGKSSNEVLITDSPTSQTKVKIAPYLPKTISVDYFDNMNSTVLRFSTLEEAAKAYSELKIAMPDARVSLPVSYSLLRPK
jgi:hypothetical protein